MLGPTADIAKAERTGIYDDAAIAPNAKTMTIADNRFVLIPNTDDDELFRHIAYREYFRVDVTPITECR